MTKSMKLARNATYHASLVINLDVLHVLEIGKDQINNSSVYVRPPELIGGSMDSHFVQHVI